MITREKLNQLIKLLANGREEEFYHWPEWKKTRLEVLRMDRFECQWCKKEGRYSRAIIVHHIKPLRVRPDLALSIWDDQTGERQLAGICKAHHELEHPEALKQFKPSAPPLTVERWD